MVFCHPPVLFWFGYFSMYFMAHKKKQIRISGLALLPPSKKLLLISKVRCFILFLHSPNEEFWRYFSVLDHSDVEIGSSVSSLDINAGVWGFLVYLS